MGKPITTKTPEQLNKQREYAKQNKLPEGIYEDFGIFAKYMIPAWGSDNLEWEWFHHYICDNMNEMIKGDLNFLTIETHSQLGKSVLVSLYVCYILGLNPNKSIMYFTYNESAAVKFTKNYILTFLGSEKYRKVFPFIALKNDISKDDHTRDISMKKKISTLKDNEFNVVNPFVEVNQEYRGVYVAFGIGQGSHGRPADIMILDDYVDKAESIKSQVYRDKLRTSFENDIILRFQANTLFLVICTRWYDDDPIGLLMEKMPIIIQGYADAGVEDVPKMKSIKIRAEYRVNDDNPVCDPRTKEGEWLWKPMLSKYLMAKGGKYFNATFNCDPSNALSEMRLRKEDFGFYYAHQLPSHGGLEYFSIDGASATHKKSDFSVIGRWLVFGRNRYLVQLWKLKVNIPTLERFVIKLLTEDYPNYHKCLIEYANSGISICQKLLEMHIRVTPLSFACNEISDNKPTVKKNLDIKSSSNSKVDRYLRMLPEIMGNEKRLHLPYDDIEHLDEYIKQLTSFDGDDLKHDDFVDMTSYLVNYTAKNMIVIKSKSVSTNDYIPKNNNLCYNLKNPNYFMKE